MYPGIKKLCYFLGCLATNMAGPCEVSCLKVTVDSKEEAGELKGNNFQLTSVAGKNDAGCIHVS